VIFSGSLDGHVRAYEAETGRVIWDVDTTSDIKTVNGVAARGGSLNGPGATISNGMVYVSSGYAALGFMPGNLLLAFSVDGK
jgi:polyvinyl alcohol dehydrogenase (cytochrome)